MDKISIYFNGDTLISKILWIIIITFTSSSYIYINKYHRDIKHARREFGISTRSNWQFKNAPKMFKLRFFFTYFKAFAHISVFMTIVSSVYINSFTIIGNEIITFFLPIFILCSNIVNSDKRNMQQQEEYNKYTLIDNLLNIIDLIKEPIINIFIKYSPNYFVKQEQEVIIGILKDSNYYCYEKYYINKNDPHLGEYILRLKDTILRNVGEEKIKKDDLSECFSLNIEEQRLELEYINELKKALENLIKYYINSLNSENNIAPIQIYYELNKFVNNPHKYAKVESFICLANIQAELNQSAQINNKTIDEINDEINKFYNTNYSIKQLNNYTNDDEMRNQIENFYNNSKTG